MRPNILLIWDFDGVIADCEHLWVENWTDIIDKKYGIKLSPAQQQYYLEGKAEKTKISLLIKDFPQMTFDNDFWHIVRSNEAELIDTKLEITPHVTDILSDTNFAHCIATGAIPDKHNKKVEKLGLKKYFDEQNTFTATMVQNGKPEPDLFIYAAQKMGYLPENCIVIEDSTAGIIAAKKADMKVIAYIGATNHNTDEYIAQCRKYGADFIASTMTEVHTILKKFHKRTD